MSKQDKGMSRRAAIGAIAAVASACRAPNAAGKKREVHSKRMPTMFIPHGGGPWPVLQLPMMAGTEASELRGFMTSIANAPPEHPKALLVISAHWEESRVTINAGASPGL